MNIRRGLAIVLLAAALPLLVWSLWAGPQHAQEQTLTRAQMQLPADSAVPGVEPPAMPEERLLKLEWPSRLRQGESNQSVWLTLTAAEGGEITPTLSAPGSETIEEPLSIPNIYDTHNVMAEARLDLAGMAVAPEGLTSLSLRPGETVTFRWNLRATEVGTYRGTLWLYLLYLPLDGGPESRDALKAIDIQIQVVNFLGIGGPAARLLGVAGMIACGLFGASDLVSGVRWLNKRLSKKR